MNDIKLEIGREYFIQSDSDDSIKKVRIENFITNDDSCALFEAIDLSHGSDLRFFVYKDLSVGTGWDGNYHGNVIAEVDKYISFESQILNKNNKVSIDQYGGINISSYSNSYGIEECNKNDSINNPAHYNNEIHKCSECDSNIECIDIVRNLNFNLGNAIKYIWRCDYKDNSIEDLKKAIWYLSDEIKKREVKNENLFI